jgi:hypothetical protein
VSTTDVDLDRLIADAGKAAAKMRRASDDRNRAIVAALDAGVGQRELARATGLSHPGIAKIAAHRTNVDD